MSLKEICQGLDETLLEFFSTLDGIYSAQQELESTMKDGYLYMSKARYSMGIKAVSPLQYDTDNMGEAQVHVNTETDDDRTTFHIAADESSSEQPQDSSSQDSGLRHRTKKSPSNDDFTDLTEAVEELKMTDMSDKNKARPQKKDPIKWFGVLVPQALRQSQGRFKKAVELSVEIANMEAKYLSLQAKYKDLAKQKAQLMAEADFSPNIEDYDFGENGLEDLKLEEEEKEEEEKD